MVVSGEELKFHDCARLRLGYNEVRRPVTSGRLPRKELPMDTQTVIALCDLMLVFIGIIGLFLVRKE